MRLVTRDGGLTIVSICCKRVPKSCWETYLISVNSLSLVRCHNFIHSLQPGLASPSCFQVCAVPYFGLRNLMSFFLSFNVLGMHSWPITFHSITVRPDPGEWFQCWFLLDKCCRIIMNMRTLNVNVSRTQETTVNSLDTINFQLDLIGTDPPG